MFKFFTDSNCLNHLNFFFEKQKQRIRSVKLFNKICQMWKIVISLLYHHHYLKYHDFRFSFNNLHSMKSTKKNVRFTNFDSTIENIPFWFFLIFFFARITSFKFHRLLTNVSMQIRGKSERWNRWSSSVFVITSIITKYCYSLQTKESFQQL